MASLWKKKLQTCPVLQTESVDIIKSENLLVPSFKNSCDYPEDIFELPYGIDTYIKSYPKLSRPQRSNIVFERSFIRECVKSLENKLRDLYNAPESSIFWSEGSFLKKHDVGGTNFWPIEYYDMGLEIMYYLQALQSDIEKKFIPIPGTIMKGIVVPEILTHLIAAKCKISHSEAFLHFKAHRPSKTLNN